jgi:magnesium transporter
MSLDSATHEQLRQGLEGPSEELRQVLQRSRPADLADWLQGLEDGAMWRVFDCLDTEAQSALLEYASEELRARIVPRLGAPQLVELVDELPTDEVVDILAFAPAPLAQDVLRQVDTEVAADVRELSSYPDDSAGGIMTTDVDVFPPDARVGDVLKALRKDEDASQNEGAGVYVVDARRRPVGFVSDRELLTTPIHSLLSEVMDPNPVTVAAWADQEDVAQLIARYGVSAVAVLGSRGELVGVVTADDALEVIEEEAEEDFGRLVGVSDRQPTRMPVWRRVAQRLPLMGLTVLGGMTTAHILDWALGSVDEAHDTLRYVPTVLGLAGNVGLQSSTILVRGLATGEIEPERRSAVFGQEVLTGTLIGCLCGLATLLIAALTEGSPGAPAWAFGNAMGVAIAIAVAWSAFLGCLVPTTCDRLGLDPAIVSGPFLTALSDVSGTGFFMLVAHTMLGAGFGAGG